jgi:hypothetical protein
MKHEDGVVLPGFNVHVSHEGWAASPSGRRRSEVVSALFQHKNMEASDA